MAPDQVNAIAISFPFRAGPHPRSGGRRRQPGAACFPRNSRRSHARTGASQMRYRQSVEEYFARKVETLLAAAVAPATRSCAFPPRSTPMPRRLPRRSSIRKARSCGPRRRWTTTAAPRGPRRRFTGYGEQRPHGERYRPCLAAARRVAANPAANKFARTGRRTTRSTARGRASRRHPEPSGPSPPPCSSTSAPRVMPRNATATAHRGELTICGNWSSTPSA